MLKSIRLSFRSGKPQGGWDVRKFDHLLWKAGNGQQHMVQNLGARQVHPQRNNPLAVEMDAAPDRPAQPAGLSPQASCDVDRDPDAVDDHDPARAVEVGFSAGALDRCDYLASAARDVRIQRDAAVDRVKLKFRLIFDQPVRILEAPEVMNVGRAVWQALGFID